MNTLLVEDDQLLAEGLIHALKKNGFQAQWACSGRQAQELLFESPPDLMVLDLGLPDIDGLELLSWMRRDHSQIPVLILTARDTVGAKVAGLDSGADDYLVKPFSTDELLARLRVQERRMSGNKETELKVGPVTLSLTTFDVFVNDDPITLSHKEFMLLKALMQNINAVQTRRALENQLYHWGEEVSSNAIDVHIHNLRKKIGGKFIQTIRGVGYMVKHHEIN